MREDWVDGGGWRSAVLIGILALASSLPEWGAAAVQEGRSAWAGLRDGATDGGSAEAPAADDVAALLREATRAAEGGRPAAAVPIFTRAVTMDPAQPEAYDGLAQACLELGDQGCARRAYRALARTLGSGLVGAPR